MIGAEQFGINKIYIVYKKALKYRKYFICYIFYLYVSLLYKLKNRKVHSLFLV